MYVQYTCTVCPSICQDVEEAPEPDTSRITHLISKHLITLVSITCCMAPGRKNFFLANTIMTMLQGALHKKKHTAAGFKTIHIGTDKLHVRILKIAPFNGKSWKKKSSFESLTTPMRSHMDNLSILDFVTVVSTEIPLDTTTAFIEVGVVK